MHYWRSMLAVLLSLSLAACSDDDDDDNNDTLTSGYTLSGTITASSGQVIDSDNADANDVPRTRNDSAETAQELTFSSVVAGWVGDHDDGDGTTFQDEQDVYRVTLTAGQVVYLDVADAPAADLDLCLLAASSPDTQVTPCSDSDTATRERVVAPSDGEFLVQVLTISGSSNYALSFANASSSDSAALGWPEFVPGELLVRFRDAAGSAASAGQSLGARASALGLEPRSGGERGAPLRVGLGTSEASRAQALQALGVKRPAPGSLGSPRDPTAAALIDTLRARKALRAQADVLSADLNFVFRPLAGPPQNEHYDLQWHYPLIQLEQAWGTFAAAEDVGKGVVVGVIDTGVYLAHPDVSGQLVQGYDFITDPARANDGDGRDSNPDDAGDGETIEDSSWHGTHVSGTIAAAWREEGAAGVAPGARIMPLRVLGVNGGTSADIDDALLFAAGLASAGGRTLAADERPAILSLSLGCTGCYSETDEAIYAKVRDAGIVVIAAAGNDGLPVASYPASYAGVISVSAVTINKTRAYYSNFGSNVDIAAPGGDTSRDLNGDGYGDGVLSAIAGADGTERVPSWSFYQGTSMATPHVSGVVALMKSVCSDLSPDMLDDILRSGEMTTDLGSDGRDDLYGYGLVDAMAAVQTAAERCGEAVPAGVEVTPDSLDFGKSTTELEVTTSKTGGSDGDGFGITAASTDAAWVTVEPKEGATLTSGFGPYTVRVDRSSLGEGTYTASVIFTRSDGVTVEVPVTAQVGAGGAEGDTGFLYVLLMNEETGDVWQLEKQGGTSLAYSFTGLEAGRYYVGATTDLDGDGEVCDAGEVCGAWPTLTDASAIEISADVSGRDFVVELERSVTTSGGPAAGWLGGLRLQRAKAAGATP